MEEEIIRQPRRKSQAQGEPPAEATSAGGRGTGWGKMPSSETPFAGEGLTGIESEGDSYSPALRLSPSVEGTVDEFSTQEKISAFDVINRVLKYHSEYGQSLVKEFGPSDPSHVERRTVSEWLVDVRTVFDPSKAQELHGRLLVIGLALLDSDVTLQLSSNGFLQAVKAELREPLDTLLSARGRDLAKARQTYDTVPTHPDIPAKTDALGRQAFAKALAIRIRRIRQQDLKLKNAGPFRIQLTAPWGAGKTSLLNFLRDELQAGDKQSQWIVIDFNAWQHQRLGAPWWWLMSEVYRQSVRQLWNISKSRSVWLVLREHGWRFRMAWFPYVCALAIVTALSFLALKHTGLAAWLSELSMKDAGDIIKTVVAAATLAGTLWAALIAMSRFMLLGSAKTAESFMETKADPMQALATHFKDLVKAAGQPIAVFVDDLDRCDGNYVIQLLEGIQTIFKDATVTFVIAADRRWLTTSFEKAYAAYVAAVDEPGRPLGHLFLEKTFQLSASIPRMSDATRTSYFRNLIGVDSGDGEQDIWKAQTDAEKRMQELITEEQILRELEKPHVSSAYDHAIRAAAVVRLAAPEVEARTEHTLRAFAPLLDRNPRAMKRFVNAYGVQRAIATLSGVEIGRQELALWTVLALRWPYLAEHLEEHPDAIESLDKDTLAVPERLRGLLKDRPVRDVLDGKGVGKSLTKEVIEACATLRTSDAGPGSVA